MGGGRRDTMGRGNGRGQGVGLHPAAIAVGSGLHEGMRALAVQHQHVGPHQKLPVARSAGHCAEVEQRHRDRGGLPLDIARRGHETLQRDMRHARRRGRGAPVSHVPRPSASAARIARAPWPAPPLGRPGAAVCCQP